MKTINIKINVFLYLLDQWNRKLFLVWVIFLRHLNITNFTKRRLYDKKKYELFKLTTLFSASIRWCFLTTRKTLLLISPNEHFCVRMHSHSWKYIPNFDCVRGCRQLIIMQYDSWYELLYATEIALCTPPLKLFI